MKLIIDIPEEVKQTFDNAQNEDLYGNYYDRNSLIGKAIQNGIPLDKIRAEISDFEEEVFQRPNTDYSDYAAVRHCLEIIDMYRNEVSS